jgi:hypothetical protein
MQRLLSGTLLYGLAVLAVSISPLQVQAKTKEDKRVLVGWVEKVYIPAIDSQFKAKLDTGAKTSSISAEVIDLKENDKEKRKKMKEEGIDDPSHGTVIFAIEDEDGKKRTIERMIERFVRIKTKKEDNYIRRPVVNMQFCVAGALVEEEVNLADRDHFNYPVLIGRNMLEQSLLVVDASKTYTARANCPKGDE